MLKKITAYSETALTDLNDDTWENIVYCAYCGDELMTVKAFNAHVERENWRTIHCETCGRAIESMADIEIESVLVD